MSSKNSAKLGSGMTSDDFDSTNGTLAFNLTVEGRVNPENATKNRQFGSDMIKMYSKSFSRV